MFDLLRRNRDFRALFASEVVSLGGDWFATVAILGVLSDTTHGSTLAAAGIFVAAMLPSFFLSPLAGPVADRFDRRIVMIVSSLVAAIAALGFLLVAPGRIWLAYVAQLAIASLAAFFAPAAGASVPNLVDPEDLPTAIRATSSLWGIMLAVGAAVGAVFANVFGRDAAFIANAVSFVVAAGFTALIKRPTNASSAARPKVRPLHDTREALAYAKNDPTLVSLLLAKGGVGLAGGVVVLLTTLAVEKFNRGDSGVGVLLAARGLGVVIGPLLAKRYTRDDATTIIKVCALASVLYGAAYVGVAAAPYIVLAAIATAVAHLGGGVQWALSVYGIQARADDAFRGRVLAADMALVTLASTLSYVGSAALQHIFGTSGAMAILGVVAMAWGLLYLRLTRPVRQPAAVRGDVATTP